ncbi:MAG: hypothetical protein KZQ99_03565 [Candidatus Thiodiazotropha sp. (ex Dulcina madagascariensis)]|nr:hypothetical protein [Candidatus Thiodiazotropha sp. (ex Dulcina madagascariensis)]
MIEWLSSIPAELFTLFLTGLSTLVIVIGMPIALINLKLIARTLQFQSVSRFMDELGEASDERRFVYREFDRDCDFTKLDSETIKKIEKVINSLNRIYLFIDNKTLPPEQVLSISHTVIIRCWYKLENYIKYKEKALGARYARRIEKFYYRACRFHDIRPHQRINAIKLEYADGSSIEIYRTRIYDGSLGLVQEVVWGFQRLLHIY